MTDLDPEAQAAISRIHDQIEEAQQRAAKAAALRDELDALRQSATSPGREVYVEVDSMGRVRDLGFSDAAYRLRPADLAAEVLATLNSAHTMAGEASMAKIEQAFGAESETTAALRDTFMPPPPADPEPAPRPPAPGRGPIISRH